MNFKVVKRDKDECEHDTGLCHSIGMSCAEAEQMAKQSHVFDSDPLHDEIWHKDVELDGGVYDVTPEDEVFDEMFKEAPTCIICQVIMVRNHDVYICKHCGSAVPIEWVENIE